MKYCISFAVLLCIILILFLFIKSSDIPLEIDYNKYSVYVHCETKAGIVEEKCVAVLCAIDSQCLTLCTARHFFENKKNDSEHIDRVVFPSGIKKNIKQVFSPDIDIDLALIKVDLKELILGKDFSLLENFPVDIDCTGQYVTYKNNFRKNVDKKILKVYRQDSCLITLLEGKVDKGESGTPVFIKGTSKCIGIVSGYYSAKEGEIERTKVISIFNLDKYNWKDIHDGKQQ